jgi:hypothetical protein
MAMHYHLKKGVVSFYISLMHVFVQKKKSANIHVRATEEYVMPLEHTCTLLKAFVLTGIL